MHRRYTPSWSRNPIAAASIVVLGVLGYLQVNTSHVVAQSLPSLEYRESQKSVNSDVIVAANTNFGFKLFSEVLKKDSGLNVFVSPSSVAIALAMTYNGASGSTQEAMAKTLELQGLSLSEINSSYSALKELLENPEEGVQLTIANSLWARQDFPFKSDFLQRNQDFYNATVTNLDFNDPTAPNTINNWVNENTRGKIDKIVEQINSDDVLFLINAIYFKGNWTEQFDKQRTTDYPFYLSSGEQKQHPMMSQTGDYRYYENEHFQAISLPYADGRISLYIFLPQQDSNLKDFYENLNAQNWENWMTQFRKQKGFIRLPRFKMEYDVTLNDALTALGMGEAFTDKADFSHMSDSNLAISKVQHKTFVEVNEEGTEAAAVTSVKVSLTSAVVDISKPFQMIVDRPFFCAIRDNRTGTVLFMGSIEEPQS